MELSKTILFVDDTPKFFMIFEQFYSGWNLSIFHFSNGKRAIFIRISNHNVPNILELFLLDIHSKFLQKILSFLVIEVSFFLNWEDDFSILFLQLFSSCEDSRNSALFLNWIEWPSHHLLAINLFLQKLPSSNLVTSDLLPQFLSILLFNVGEKS